MLDEMLVKREILHFLPGGKDFYLTEFGHSDLNGHFFRGPWTRKIYILHFVVKGTCRFSSFDASVGDAFLIAKDELHSFSTSGAYEHFWLGFSGEGADRLLRGLGFAAGRHTRFCVAEFERIKTLLYSTFAQCKALPRDEAERYARSVFLSLLPYLLPCDHKEKRGYDLDAAK